MNEQEILAAADSRVQAMRREVTVEDVAKLKMAAIDAYGRDKFAHGSVIAFGKQFVSDGTMFQYAAIKVGDGRWYTTGASGPQAASWDKLVTWLVSGLVVDRASVVTLREGASQGD